MLATYPTISFVSQYNVKNFNFFWSIYKYLSKSDLLNNVRALEDREVPVAEFCLINPSIRASVHLYWPIFLRMLLVSVHRTVMNAFKAYYKFKTPSPRAGVEI